MSKSITFSDLSSLMDDTDKEPVVAPPATRFLEELYEWLAGPYEKTVHYERTGGLHASSLSKTCARKEILSALFDMRQIQPPQKAGNKFTQDLGHALHQWWQERYLGPQGVLIGDWHCVACGTTTNGKMPLDCPCGADWRDAVHYKELVVNVPELQVTGATDGILVDALTGTKRIFEFKSKSTNQFRMIHGPVYDHVIQTHVYMKGLNLREAIIVYMDKGKQCPWRIAKGIFKSGKPNIKAYLVKFDDELWKDVSSVVHEYHKARELIDSGVVNSDLEVDAAAAAVSKFTRICPTSECNLAKSCHVVENCFSLPPKPQVIDV